MTSCEDNCLECKVYNHEKFYCPKWCSVIKATVNDAYNQALEDMKKGIKEILEDNAIHNIDCIDTLVKQLTK